MKNKYLLLLLSVFLIISCSSDDDTNPENSKRPKKYTVQEVNEQAYSWNFEYSGNYITKMTSSYGAIVDINYNSNNQVTSYSYNNGNTYNVTYENELLKEIRLNGNSEYFIFEYNSQNQVIKSTHNDNGYLIEKNYRSDTNGNIIESSDNYSTFKFIYDNTNNPFKNVFPQIDAEIGWSWFGNLVNNQIEVQEKIGTNDDFVTKYTYEYTLDSDNFSTERRQLDTDGNITETVTYQYY